MIGWFVWGAMNLARTIKYVVLARWTRIILFERLFPLTRLRATESDIDRHILGVVIVISTFVHVASRLVVAIFGFRGAGVACIVFAMGQPTILTRRKAGHECREGCHGLRLFLAEVPGQPFVTDAMFKGR